METPWDVQRKLVQFILLQYQVVIASPFDDKTGVTFRELSTSLEQRRFKKNVGLIAGSSTGIFAGGLGIAGIALMPFTFGIGLGLTISSIVVGVASAGVNLGFLIVNYLKDKGVREQAQPTIEKFAAIRETLVKLAVYIETVYDIVRSIEQTGDLNDKAEENGFTEMDSNKIKKRLDDCQDIQELTKEALAVARLILDNLKLMIRKNPNEKLRQEWETQIVETLKFGEPTEDKDPALLENIIQRRRRRRQAAERKRLASAVERLLKLDVTSVQLASRNVSMLFYIFFTDHENFADISKNQEENNLQMRESPGNPQPEVIVTLENALPILVALSAKHHFIDSAKNVFHAGKPFVRHGAKVANVAANGGQIGQNAGIAAVKVAKGIPVAGIVLSVFGIALDATSLGLAAYDLRQCRKKVLANFSQGLSEISQIIMETNQLFGRTPAPE